MGSAHSKKSPTISSNGSFGTPSSSSAAFGRLRFDSPGKSPLLHRLSQRRRASLLAHQKSPSAASSSSALTRVSSATRIIKATKQQQRRLEAATTTTNATDTNTTSEQSSLLFKTKEEDSSSPSPPSSEILTPPALMVWMGPALCCALCYALYNIFIKKGSSHISPILGGVILQLVAVLFGSALLLYLVLTTNNNNPLSDKDVASSIINTTWEDSNYYTEFNNHNGMFMTTTATNSSPTYTSSSPTDSLLFWNYHGLMWAILAGVAVGAAEMISFFVSSLGVQAMQSIPIIVGGSVLMGTILGWLWLGEQLSIIGWSGVLLISIGIGLVGLDAPADSGGHH